jgi:DNA invertase Pin-like site-specific DNA recombinase
MHKRRPDAQLGEGVAAEHRQAPDLTRRRTREGMAVARARGKLRGKPPKLSEKRQKELRRMFGTGDYSISDLAELFEISRPTVYRTLKREVTA